MGEDRTRGPSRPAGADRSGESGWQGILYGDINPTRDNVRLFAEAFELDEKEATSLARLYVFGK